MKIVYDCVVLGSAYLSLLHVTEAELLLRMYWIDRLLPFMVVFDGMDGICCGLKDVTNGNWNGTHPIRKHSSYRRHLKNKRGHMILLRSTLNPWINEQLYHLNRNALEEILFEYIENIIGLCFIVQLTAGWKSNRLKNIWISVFLVYLANQLSYRLKEIGRILKLESTKNIPANFIWFTED